MAQKKQMLRYICGTPMHPSLNFKKYNAQLNGIPFTELKSQPLVAGTVGPAQEGRATELAPAVAGEREQPQPKGPKPGGPEAPSLGGRNV